MKVLIKESQPLMAYGLNNLIENEFSDATINLAQDKNDAFNFMDKINYDLYIFDTELPLGEMTSLIESVKQQQKDAKILVCGNKRTVNNEFLYISMGASGFLTKESALNQFITAINLINAGQIYLSQKAIRESAKIETFETRFNKKLSKRELQVFKLLVKGNTVNNIAEQLQLKQSTVSTLKRRVLMKTKVSNVVELAIMANQLGYN